MSRRVWFPVSGGGGGNNSITAPLGSLTLGGLVPTITQGNSIYEPSGALITLSGLVPSITQGNSIYEPSGALLTLSGLVPTFQQGNTMDASGATGTLTLSGEVPTITQGNSIYEPSGALLTLSGLVPSFTQGNSLSVPIGSITLSGLVPSFSSANSIIVPMGALVLAGLAPAFVNVQPTTPSGGAFPGEREVRKLRKRSESILPAPPEETPPFEAMPAAEFAKRELERRTKQAAVDFEDLTQAAMWYWLNEDED